MKLIFYISILVLAKPVFSQDIHFSQTDKAHLNLNPALAGFENDLNISANYKIQWNPTNAPFRTYAVAADMLFKPRSRSAVKMTSGLFLFRDDAGDPKLSTTVINANVGAKLRINDQNYFGTALYLGYRQLAINGADGQWSSQYDGTQFDPTIESGELFNQMSIGGLNSGLGVVYQLTSSKRKSSFNGGSSLMAGAALFNANKPKNSFLGDKKERLDQRYSFFIKGDIGIYGTILRIQPAAYYHLQGKFQEIFFGSFFDFNIGNNGAYKGKHNNITLGTGLFYRWKDAVSAQLRFNYGPMVAGISYDFNTSDLIMSTKVRGGLEVYLSYQIKNRKK